MFGYLERVPLKEKIMMYANKFAAAVRVNSKVLREYKDTVYLPFGSEYQIRLKNLNTVRALVYVYIDGENTTPGGLVVNAGQEIDFERSLANGSLTEGNKFKFIERTGKIEDHRGIKIEDGLIRIEYQFEKVYPKNPPLTWTTTPAQPYYNGITWSTSNNAVLRSSSYQHDGVACSSADYAYTSCSVGDMLVGSAAVPQTETGITVAGSKSEQKFVTVNNFITETEKHSIVLKLLGETEDNKAIREPITVKKKPKCVTCGKQNKATAKFCSECGTALEIFA